MFSVVVKFFKKHTGKLTIGVPGQHTVYLFGEFSLKGFVQLETVCLSLREVMGSSIWGVDETFLQIMFLEIILVSDVVES